MVKKRIGIILFTLPVLIGIFIMPIGAAVSPSPSYFFAVDGNLFSYGYGSASNCTVSYNSSNDRIELTTSGNGQECRYFLYAGSNSLSLSPGNYSFGLLYSDSVNDNVLRLIINSNGSEVLETTKQDFFTLDSPSLLQVVINVPASSNTSVRTINLRPYLIYANDSSEGILHAFQGSIVSFFNGLKSGLLLISDSLIGVDKLPTNLGYIFLLTIGFILCVFIIDFIFKFIAGLIHGRR